MRKALGGGAKLEDVDRLWLAEYDEKLKAEQERAKQATTAEPKDYGRSRSARKINLQIDEAQEAEGTGKAAELAAAALQAKEEGRRLDSLTVTSIDVLKAAVQVYKDVCLTIKEQWEVQSEAHVAILQSGRQHYLERVELEGAMMRLQQEIDQRDDDDPAKAILEMLIAKHMGIQLPGARRLRPPRRPPPGANGAAKP